MVMKIREDNVTPTFVVHFWDVSKEKCRARGHDVSSQGLSKKWRKHFWAGTVTRAKSNSKPQIFHSVSELLAYFEKNRVDD